MKSKICFIYTTWPNRHSAKRAAKMLLDERLIACANIIGPMTSLYRWRGKIENSKELVMILKMQAKLYPRTEKRIRELHPYDCPCVVMIETPQAIPEFASWIAAETRS